MKLNARVLMHLALGTSSLAMLGCEPAPPPVQRPEPLVMESSAPAEPERVQPDTAPESRPGASVRFATPPDMPPAPAVAPEPVVEPAPVAPVSEQPRPRQPRVCGPCGRG